MQVLHCRLIGVGWGIAVNWWAYGEHRYGDRKAIVESDDWEGLKFQACMDCGMVAKAFDPSLRSEVLSFSHHRVLVSLPEDWRTKLLDWACEPLKEGKAKPLNIPPPNPLAHNILRLARSFLSRV